MRTIIKTEEPSHDPTGWFNFCPACGGRYWVRASDLGHNKSRRWRRMDDLIQAAVLERKR